MKKVLVFDFGASSARAMLCCYNGKRIVSHEIHRFANKPVTVLGKLCWDIDNLFKEVKKAISKAGDFDAVSVDTWGVDFALMNKTGEFVEKPVHYRDERTKGVPEKVWEIIGEKELYKRTGIQFMRFNTIYQLYSVKTEAPELFELADHLLMMPDVICNYLTGEFKNEYTEATTTQLINPVTRDWDWELIDRLGFPQKLFGEIIKPGDVYGYLKPEFCGKEVPVIAAPSHDTASAVVAIPAEEKDFAFISCGTWTLFGTELEKAIPTEEAMAYGLTNEGGYGNTTTFLKNIMGMWLIQECKRYYQEKGDMFTYDQLEVFAKSAVSVGAFINPNAEDFAEPGNMPEKIQRYCERTGQPVPKSVGQILRVIYESLSLEFARTLNGIEKITGKTYPTVYMFGGGSKDALLCRLTANATGRTVCAGPSEATAEGNSISALIKLGEIADVPAARSIMRNSGCTKIYEPDGMDDRAERLDKYISTAI